MEIEVWRDWIIVIQGIIQIILILVLIVLTVVMYSRINNVIKSGKKTLYNIERSFASPYYKAGSWIFGWLAEAIWEKKKKKSGEE